MKRLAIALSVALGLLAAPPAHAGDGIKALSLLPADTTIVLAINFKRLRRSSSYANILAAAQARDSYKEGVADLKRAGIDIERDVDTLMLGVRGAGGDADGVVLIAEGRFRPAKLIKVLREKNSDMQTRTHRGVRYYTIDNEGSLAILGRRVVLAENARMPAVIDLHVTKGRGKSVAGDREFRKLRARIDTGKDVWFVAELPKAGRAGFGVPMAENIEAFSGSLDLRRGFGLRLRISATDAASANQLVAMVKMGLGMASSNPKAQNMGLDAIAKKAVVVSDEADLVLRLDLTEAEAAKLKGIAEMAGGAM